MNVVEEVLRHPELEAAPPVLVDIGASGGPHPKWRRIRRHSVCVAFDPDLHERPEAASDRGFRRLHLFDKVVSEREEKTTHFYLTASPYCSSRLRPALEPLQDYAFASLFAVKREAELPATTLPAVLGELGLERVDWFKVDSQGTDLRLFASLGEKLLARALVAEFEPGILDAYEGEDKLADLLRFMDERGFWMSELDVKGAQRLRSGLVEEKLGPRERRALRATVKEAPGWAEVEYFNDFKQEELFGKREHLLGAALALVRGHDGFALELAVRGGARFDDPLFRRLEAAALRRIRRGYAKLPLAALRALSRRTR